MNNRLLMRLAVVWCALGLSSVGWSADVNAPAGIRPDFVMESDPRLDEPPQALNVFPDRCQVLWFEALARPEADLQRLSASTIALAHAKGMGGLIEAEPLLAKIVAAEGSHRASRFAAARALIALEARTSDRALFDASQRDTGDLRQLVEPVLAQWDFQPIRQTWRDRLAAPLTRHRDLLLAIRGLGIVGDGEAVERLLVIVDDSLQFPTTRIAAARAAGRISEAGLEPRAQRLLDANAPSISDRLCAVSLLSRHRSAAAQALHSRLAQDSEPGVAAIALGCLNEIDPHLVLPLAEQVMQNSDPHVRQQGADAFAALPTPERAVFLVQLLDDPHPDVRARVCGYLFRLADIPECNAPIRDAAMGLLTKESWRGQEQAALLLSALDHKPAAGQLVALLESPRGEVMVAAAWGLRKLAVAETLPAILDKAERQSGPMKQFPSFQFLNLQVAHLFEALSVQNYAAAEQLWRKYIPKDYSFGEHARGAAIWALGRLYAGKADAVLAKLLVERLTDPAPPPLEPPEMMRVRVMCAVALARMGDKSQLERMRRYLGSQAKPVPSSLAIRWAVKELTGETLPFPEPERILQSGWFLEPLEQGNPGQ
jgi:HEAT repeat protein